MFVLAQVTSRASLALRMLSRLQLISSNGICFCYFVSALVSKCSKPVVSMENVSRLVVRSLKCRLIIGTRLIDG